MGSMISALWGSSTASANEPNADCSTIPMTDYNKQILLGRVSGPPGEVPVGPIITEAGTYNEQRRMEIAPDPCGKGPKTFVCWAGEQTPNLGPKPPLSPEQQAAEDARIAAGEAKWARLLKGALTPQQQKDRWLAQCGRVVQLRGISQQQVQDMLDGPRDHPYNLLTEEQMQELMASNPTGF